MTLYPPLNDECYESSLIENLICLDIDNGSPQEEFEHFPHSLLVPKYARLVCILANRPSDTSCCEQFWNRGWQQPHTQVHLQVRSGWRWCNTTRNSAFLIGFKKRTMKYQIHVSVVKEVDQGEN